MLAPLTLTLPPHLSEMIREQAALLDYKPENVAIMALMVRFSPALIPDAASSCGPAREVHASGGMAGRPGVRGTPNRLHGLPRANAGVS